MLICQSRLRYFITINKYGTMTCSFARRRRNRLRERHLDKPDNRPFKLNTFPFELCNISLGRALLVLNSKQITKLRQNINNRERASEISYRNYMIIRIIHVFDMFSFIFVLIIFTCHAHSSLACARLPSNIKYNDTRRFIIMFV